MPTYRLALYPGDGIGLEVTPEAVKALRAVAGRFGFTLELTEVPWGHRYWRETGRLVPEGFLSQLRGYDAVFLGAVGDPEHLPDHVTLRPLLQMRQEFDQYACVRPAVLLPGVACPLAGRRPGDIDCVVVRENSEGEYADVGGRMRGGQVAVQTSVHTRHGITRLLRYGFSLARQRRGRLTMATKSNAMRYSMVLWDEILEALAPQYPEIEVEKMHVDALTIQFVREPERLDVVVGSNLFGDILSDLAGAITGSLGLAPSANLNPERTAPSLFEPVHGSAPDIAGRGLANPIAAVRSAGMMLGFLGEAEAAAAIERAVAASLASGRALTADLGGHATTAEAGDDIVRHLEAPDPADQ